MYWFENGTEDRTLLLTLRNEIQKKSNLIPGLSYTRHICRQFLQRSFISIIDERKKFSSPDLERSWRFLVDTCKVMTTIHILIGFFPLQYHPPPIYFYSRSKIIISFFFFKSTFLFFLNRWRQTLLPSRVKILKFLIHFCIFLELWCLSQLFIRICWRHCLGQIN